MTINADMSSIICFGYKIVGQKKASCVSAWDFKNWQKDVNDDSLLCKFAYELLHDADLIVTFNGKRFDFKFLQTRLIFNGLPTLDKIPHLDACQLARSNLMLESNRMNNVADFLNLDLKMEHSGWKLWEDVYQRKKTAQKLMVKYCKKDVEVLHQVYEKLKRFDNSSFNQNHFADGKNCPKCGSANLTKNGKRRTKTKVYQRLQCQDCFAFSRVNLSGQWPR